jgi:hypothetical protein
VRSYQIDVTVYSPITLRRADGPDDREAMFRFLNDLLGEVGLEVGEFARGRLEQARRLPLPANKTRTTATHGATVSKRRSWRFC